MSDIQPSSSLRENVHLLGTMLGQTIAAGEGRDFFEKIETIRQMAKSARSQGVYDHQKLAEFLNRLTNTEMVSVAKAFSHFLNLANAADQHQSISRKASGKCSSAQILSNFFAEMIQAGHTKESVVHCLDGLKIELVLTAHPTEITRRTFIRKYNEIISLLSGLELQGRTEHETSAIKQRLAELITQMWHTEDFRTYQLTPVEEARWAFSVIESSLWDAVPNFISSLETACQEQLGKSLPLAYTPVSFASWIGGDRDGNPNVTSEVTREVLLLSRQKSIDFYMADIRDLFNDLAISSCSAKLAQDTNNAHEPYRHILRQLMRFLQNARKDTETALKRENFNSPLGLESSDQLWQPLFACYQSLCACGMQDVANSKLLNLLRRIKSFGIHVAKLDIRQESGRHSQALAELVQHLGLGDYNSWDEPKKRSFLLEELQNPRPFIPEHWPCSDDVLEVLNTFREIARHPPEAFGFYVISMTKTVSDVLAVQLLMKACGCKHLLPVAPLFETLDDLNCAADVMRELSKIDWYRKASRCQQTIVIGYSDSAKDAGMLAASWQQYQAQEALLAVCKQAKFDLTLFHGRGGTIGRGGAPVQAALLSQPPGSLRRGLRITEQGETIRAKLGVDALALQSLTFYATTIIQANLEPPTTPLPKWRKMMGEIATLSCAAYRKLVRDTPGFLAYFQAVTPVQELSKLPLGSRPAKRNVAQGIENLRAIPWIFAWSQNRLMLPAWLGAGEALQKIIDRGQLGILEQMCTDWPFFSTRLSLLEMVYAKADVAVSKYYDSTLLPHEAGAALGDQLRKQLLNDMDTVSRISNDDSLIGDLLIMRKFVELRNTYVDPLNILQADLMKRHRSAPKGEIERALMMTLAGISAGLQNTG